ncbi:Crp/Fnr family transcriptional regulator [Magnetospirillum sulfuroxidans]|jgi:CRP/FNR family transcriptional activator FtrB|uniref:Cyclic nucleotide-binding domain-containing protein n=1 Tax=Magnetospirillum sulfuroxidans TaxID=611300 RepID=A0ABS5IBZ1_9PROT|nr:cyclic nucleotide-binding domain-containing protein [Magnetospirillum sulfuroxidans]MBR9971946.1 cyclic nucleotide-binding domain-containing protein [Magnetospirillum sulfuroxidans]
MSKDASGPGAKDVLLQLQFTPLFAGLAEADIRSLTEGARQVSFGHEQQIYQAGDSAVDFYVVMDGHVELSVDNDGKRSVVEVARRGAVLGDAAMFGDGTFLMSARVLTAATVLAIPAQSFLAKLSLRKDIVFHMLSTMSFRLRMLVRQIAELKLKTTAQRLGSFLLSLAAAEAGRVELRFPYDKKLVADELGMKPESLSRALAKLTKLGVESKADNVVIIADLDTLRAFCVEDDLG